ncbi:hypothetical protein TSUD_126770 [Trifolium subterraneum]|nr:hypothetical protein TSUD_126770 [Trifolium subterraneum]
MDKQIMAEAVEALLVKIVSSKFMDKFLTTKLDVSLLKKLKSTLLMLQDVLVYSEYRHIMDPTIKEFFYMLKLIVFDVSKLLEQIDLFRYQTQTDDQVLNNLSSLFKRFDMD